MAQYLLRHRLAALTDVEVASAGTGALVGSPMTPETLALLTEQGVRGAEAHTARQLDRGMVREVDLILAATRQHRLYIAEEYPSAARRLFTLRELARIAASSAQKGPDLRQDDEAPGGRDGVRPGGPKGAALGDALRAAVEGAASLRGVIPRPDRPADLDVVDPYMQGPGVDQATLSQILPAVDSVATMLLGAAGSTP
jgi:protein-tyrosine phosphatase